jgi:hypothetical protein
MNKRKLEHCQLCPKRPPYSITFLIPQQNTRIYGVPTNIQSLRLSLFVEHNKVCVSLSSHEFRNKNSLLNVAFLAFRMLDDGQSAETQ